MGLSNDLISQFVEITKQDKDNQNGATVYGTIKKLNGQDYVQIDGSELMTPIKSTTYVSDGERVTVMIKNHQAIVTGNITSPATRQTDVDTTVDQKIAEFDIIVTDQIEAQYGKFEQLVTDNITAVNGEIENLKTENLEVKNTLIAQNGEIENLKTKKLDAETANITFATIESLKATDIEVNNIKGNFAEFSQITTDNITAVNGKIENLEAEKLNVTDADIKYANIDFANIGMAAVEELFVKSGIIKDIVVGDQHITGELVGVTIKGDLIEGNTIVAEKLVVKGSDGLYYKLNTDGMKIEAQQTEYNSLNGSIITAKSITASKVMVDDLVAFDATIGGFKITDNAIYSGVKTSVNNTTTGVYLDNTGQIAFGDSNNYIKFFKDVDNQWKLMISASSMKMSTSNKTVEEAISDINEQVQGTVKLVETYYAISDSYTIPPTTGWSKNTPTWVNGKYIWSKTKTTYIDGSSSESNPACITGAKGESGTSGSAGKGIKNITNYYLATSTNSGITISTSGWTTTMQSMTSTKKYLWNYELITYTDNSTTKTNPVIIGVYGDKGQNGAAGEDGVGILSITEKYAVSSSNSTAPTTWYDTVQTMTSTNRYLWNYEIVKYTNNTTSETAKRVIGVYGDKGDRGLQGLQGPKGDQGIPGTNGTNGKTSYFHIKYSSVAKPTSSSQMTETPNTYIGTYVDYNAADSTDPTKYTWSRFEGLQGPKGDQGIPGTNGTNGKTSYLHIKYSNDGGKTFTANNGEEPGDWIGQYTDFNVDDSTSVTAYTWSLIKGESGVGITSVDVEYYLSTSATSLSGGSWSTTAPAWVNGKYMWSRTKTVNTTGTTTYSNPACITGAKGSTGATGATGKGVKSTTVTYQASTSGTTVPTGSWTTTIPTVSAGQYLWTRTVITYTDNTNTTSYSIGKMGEQGATGQNGTNGVGVKSTSVTYQASTSGTTTPTGTWSSTIPTVSAGQYLWTRTIITYTNGTSATSYSIGKMGERGPTGATGVGIKSVTNYYLASASASGVTTSTSGWTTTVQTINTTKKYLWNYEKITYTNNSTSNTDPVIIGVHGTNGANGAAGKGISSITEYYLVSSAATGITTSTSGWTTTVPSMTTTNRYLWNYEVIKYTDNSTTTGTPKVIGVYGNTGATGATGQGVSSITEEYYLSTSKTTQSGGSWTTTPPTWSTGKYIWTRSKIVYKNPTATTYTTPICDSSWEAVNEIQLGARNLTPNTGFYNGTTGWGYWNGATGMTVVAGRTSTSKALQVTLANQAGSGYSSPIIPCIGGETYTLSFWIKSTIAGYFGDLLKFKDASNVESNPLPMPTIKVEANTWTYYTNTFVTPSTAVKMYTTPRAEGRIGTPTVQLTEYKLEKGNKATDWSPAPEDITNAISVVEKKASDAILEVSKDKIIQKVSDTFTTKTESTTLKNQLDQNKQNIRCNNVGAKINYSAFSTPNKGEIYLHGYDNNNNPIDANGLIYWNGTTVSVPKGVIDPNANCGLGNDVIIFINRSNGHVYGGWYDSTSKNWKCQRFIGGTDSGTFTPTINHIAIGMFNMKDAETFNYAFLFDNPQSLRNLTVGAADLITRMNSAEQKITSDAIISTVTSSSSWSEVNKKIINNFSISGNMNRWRIASNVSTIRDSDTVGKYLDITTTGDITVFSDKEEIDPLKSYKVSLMVQVPCATGTGSWYFGLYAYDKNGVNIGVYLNAGTTLNTNAYFHSEIKAKQNTSWRTFESYIYGANVDVDKKSPKGNCNAFAKLHGKTKYLVIRFLHFRSSTTYGDGSSGSMYFAHPTISEIDGLITDTNSRLNSAEQKITPTAILQAVNTQIGAGGQINTVSTILDKTGFTVKNGAIKVQNKAGSTVLSGDTNGNLVMSGSINVNTQNSQQLYVNTSDSKSPILVSQSKGTYCQSLAVTNDFLAWNNENAWSGVSIKPSGISTPNLNASSISTNGTITASIVHATSNGQGTNFKIGDDCWIGDINEANTMIVKGVANSNAAYIKLGAGGKIGHNGSGGSAIDLLGNTWVEGGLTATGSLRTADKLYFTRSDTGYWLQAKWSYNRYSIEAPNFTGNGLLSNDKIYLRSKSSYGGMILDTGGYFYPEQNNGVSIGHPNGYRISTLYYTNLSAASDLKLKENISYINTSDIQTMSVDEVINTKDFYTFVKDELRLATFDYKTVDKDEQSNRGKIGFIAQDISETKVGKHLLKKDEIKQIDLVDVDKMILDEGETVLSYDLTDYVNVLAGALQEATKKIDLLENEKETLKTKVVDLERKNLELESRLKSIEELLMSK